jgi:hypothetical protein
MGFFSNLLTVFLLFSWGPSCFAMSQEELFKMIAHNNYSSTKGGVTYGEYAPVHHRCEIIVSGLPGSFRVKNFLDYSPALGRQFSGVSYSFKDAIVSEGQLSWTSYDNKSVVLIFDPESFKIKSLDDGILGCKIY